MIPDYLRYYLPLYGFLYWLICFFWRDYNFRKKHGKSALVRNQKDSAQEYIWKGMFGVIGFCGIMVVSITFFPDDIQWIMPLSNLWRSELQITGMAISAVSLAWCSLAQWQMGSSWRVGIEAETKTELVAHGLYTISRNPIYLGMTGAAIAFFLMLPSAMSLLAMICGRMLMQIQVRLEEEYLAKMHGDDFSSYIKKVRRWL